MPKKQKYYAVHKGKEPGVYLSWDRCKEQISGFSGPIFQKCNTIEEARHFAEHGKVKAPTNIFNYIRDNRLVLANGKKITVFTDGDLIRDGNKVYAGYGVWFGEGDERNMSQPLLEENPTNNRAEMTAVIEALTKVNSEMNLGAEINIYTDSQYVIQCFTSTGEKYKNRGYKKKNGDPVPNADLVKTGMELIQDRHVIFHKVRAHTGGEDELSIGNWHADRLAMAGTLSHYLMANKINLEDQIMTFGKHQGKKLNEVPESYLEWIASKEEIERRIPLLYRSIVSLTQKS